MIMGKVEIAILDMSLEITNSRLQPPFPGANELMAI